MCNILVLSRMRNYKSTRQDYILYSMGGGSPNICPFLMFDISYFLIVLNRLEVSEFIYYFGNLYNYIQVVKHIA